MCPGSLKGGWVGFFVPGHHILNISMILLEASKALLNKHSTTVVEMVGWLVGKVHHAVPSSPTVNLSLEF